MFSRFSGSVVLLQMLFHEQISLHFKLFHGVNLTLSFELPLNGAIDDPTSTFNEGGINEN